MKTKFFKNNVNKMVLLLCVFTLLCQTTFAFASTDKSDKAENPFAPKNIKTSNTDTLLDMIVDGPETSLKNLVIQPQIVITDEVARITVFADPSNAPYNSGGIEVNGGTHAWITVKNTGTTNITVGKFTGVAPGKTVSLGTWGSLPEHTGLWYNFESYTWATSTYFRNNNSVSIGLTSSNLSTLNTKIANSDNWNYNANCSFFAAEAWNSVATIKLSAGVPNTPSRLSASIKSKYPSTYVYGASIPRDYNVYYANGTGTPIRSTLY